MRWKTFLSLLTGLGGAFVNTVRGEPLTLGAPLPDIVVINQDSESLRLSEVGDKPYVLVYFYPKADTPGCTAQSCSLRDAYATLTDLGVVVYGVSLDGPAEQKAFREAHRLPFTLIADPEGRVVEAFGVPRRGRFASRQAFLFKSGTLVWRDLSASTSKQAADVLAVIEGKSGGGPE